MFVVAFGLGSVVLANPAILRALNWIGAAFLLWLAWKIAIAGRGGAAAFQWINPRSWLVCASAAGAYLHAGPGSALAQGLVLGALFILASLPCCFVWLAFGATAQRFLHSDRARRTFNIAMGALLAASVGLVVR